MTSTYTINLKDAKSQPCSVTVPLAQMTAANHDALLGQNTPFLASLLLVSKAELFSQTVTHSVVKNASYERPTSGYANRENQVVFTIQADTTGKYYSMSIPAPDLDKWPFNADGKEVYDAPFSGLNLDVSTFIGLIESTWSEPETGNAGTVTRFRFVGRNL